MAQPKPGTPTYRKAIEGVPTRGDLARDRVTGFTGIVIAETVWLNGCARLTMQPQGLDEKGKPFEDYTADDRQCELLVRGVIAPGSRETGGPRPDPVRAKDPR